MASPVNLMNKVAVAKPLSAWVVDEEGYLIAFQDSNGRLTGIPTSGHDDNLTAGAGGTQNGALPLRYRNSRITTVVTVNDSCILPTASCVGMRMAVWNDASAPFNTMRVYPALGESINSLAANASVDIPENSSAAQSFTCVSIGRWIASV